MLTPEEALRIARGEGERRRRPLEEVLLAPLNIAFGAVLAVSLLLVVVSLCLPVAGKLVFGLGIGVVLAAGVWAMLLSIQDGYTWQASIPLFWIYFATQDPARWGRPVLMHALGVALALGGVFLMHGPGVAGLAQGWRPPFGIGGAFFRPAAPANQKGQSAPRRKVNEPPSADSISGLVAYWKLDAVTRGQTPDEVIGGPPSNVFGASIVPGVKGNALKFEGLGSYVELAPSPRLSFAAGDSFTWAGWVNTKDDGTLLGQRRRTDEGPVIDITVEQGNLCATVRCDGPDLNRVHKLTGTRVADGTWHHLALTRDSAGKIELFLDAQSQGQAAGADGPITTDLNAFGQERYWVLLKSGPGSPFFTGLLDEFCLFDRVLTPDELRSLAGL